MVYISRALIDADKGQLRALVARSAAHNEACGVTGMLWFDSGRFAQVLEGEQVAIDDTMRRIRADARHTDIEIICDREIRQPMFRRWSMALPDEGPEGAENTAFMIGFARTQPGETARTLYDIAIASDEFI